MNIRFGGDLKPGDLIAVGRMGYLELGWFVKEGKGTVHYYSFRAVQSYLNSTATFNPKDCKKHANINYYGTVVKITCPEEILVIPTDFATYINGTEILKTLKLI
jgi:hypothetical protein